MIGTIAFGIFGLAVLVSIAFVFSSKRGEVDMKLVASGIGLQLLFAFIVIVVFSGEATTEVVEVYATQGTQDNEGKVLRTSDLVPEARRLLCRSAGSPAA